MDAEHLRRLQGQARYIRRLIEDFKQADKVVEAKSR